MQLRSEDVAFWVYYLSCSLNIPIWIVLGISLLDLILCLWSSVPGSRCVSCVRSKVTFLSGTVSFTTGVTRWVHRFRSSLFLIICVVCIDIVGNLFVGVRICFTTVIVAVVDGAIRVLLGFVFLLFKLTALVSTVTWLSALVTSRFGFFSVLLCGLLRHSFICNSSGASKPFSSNSFSRCDTTCSYALFFKCAWLFHFFRWAGILAYMKCSIIAWAVSPKAIFASFWNWYGKSTNLWYTVLKTSRWNLCFAVAIDWAFR